MPASLHEASRVERPSGEELRADISIAFLQEYYLQQPHLAQ